MRLSDVATIRVEKVRAQLNSLNIMPYERDEVVKTLRNLSDAFNEFNFAARIEKLRAFVPDLPASSPQATELVVVDSVVSARMRASANRRLVR